jgi:ElaB/YqjD/DUF883 family membrane-anchored ribosome-binding protein
MKVSELENTPWIAQRDNELSEFTGREHWEVLDSKGYTIGQDLSEKRAKTIAALPDTLKRLKRLGEIKVAAEKTVRAIKTNPIALFNEVDKLKKALEDG